MRQNDLRPKKILLLKRAYFLKPFPKYWLLHTDTTSLFRPYTKCLPDLGYVYKPNNRVKGNKPVDVGSTLSVVSLAGRNPSTQLVQAPWDLPLSMRLIPFEENHNRFTATQINDLFDNETLPFGQALSVNALDSKYASAEYIGHTHRQKSLVNIIRLASNRNVWKGLSESEQKTRRANNSDNRGTPAIYGQKYKLSEARDWDLAPDHTDSFETTLAKGRKVSVEICIWEEMMLRSKRGVNMKDKKSRLAKVELIDSQSGEVIFQRPMWLSIWGERKAELSAAEIYWAYRSRFDIEHFFRFGKQRLLLDHFQTPEPNTWQNWIEVVNLAYWLLWVAKDEASHHPTKKWQQYNPAFKARKKENLHPSPSVVQQQMQTIILAFEKAPFLPKLQIKGKGRKQGTIFPKREPFPVRKKAKKKKKKVP
jgi:hypothetical protein